MNLAVVARRCVFVVITTAAGLAGSAHATSLRIASAFDPQTMDPHALALLYHSRVAFQIYDNLVNRDDDFKLEPALAESWEMVSPTVWRFKLRQGVKFHDGTPFTADDVVFSVERAQLPSSNFKVYALQLGKARRIDDHTVDIETP
ncbi:MAG TPA: ABC transporter substrate-binding protein, partial [Burkholderiaceae bacterium]